jgi:hypothetical protein
MAMSLSATDHEVIEVRPSEFGAWILDKDVADALVLDLENPRLSVAAVTNLRAHAKLAPVLLVSNDHPGWGDPKMGRLPGAVVLPLPVSKAAMLSALEDLLSPEWDGRKAVPPQHAEVTEALHELAETHGVLLSEDDRLDDMLAAALATPTESGDTAPVDVDPPTPEASVAPLAPGAGRKHAPGSHRRTEVPSDLAPVSSDVAPTGHPTAQSAPSDTRTLPPLPRTQRTRRLPATASSTSRSEIEALRPSTVPTVPERRGQHDSGAVPEAPEAPRPSRDDGVELVRRLRRVVDSLFGVRETAEVIIADAVERTGADAGAVMVPDDDGAWRVAAGVGLRPLEHRYELDTRSWVVREVARAHQGVIVEDSDIARDQLQGAPLASWRHLIVAPVPQVGAVLLLARKGDPPFDENDLTLLAALGEEAGPLLAAAVDTRSLARELAEFGDAADLPR